eukprot:532182-Prymnesium_polylepis.1
MGRPRAKQSAAVGNAQRAVGGGSAPLPAEPRAELEDVVVGTSPCRRSRRWKASHSSRVCSDHRGVNFPAQAGTRMGTRALFSKLPEEGLPRARRVLGRLKWSGPAK